jgi:hypothetical protein
MYGYNETANTNADDTWNNYITNTLAAKNANSSGTYARYTTNTGTAANNDYTQNATTNQSGMSYTVNNAALPTYTAPTYTAPAWDKNKVKSYSRRNAAAGLFGIKQAVREAISKAGGMSDNPYAVKQLFRSALSAQGQNISNLLTSAHNTGLSEYTAEYGREADAAKTNFQSALTAASANFQAALQKWAQSAVTYNTSTGTSSTTRNSGTSRTQTNYTNGYGQRGTLIGGTIYYT